MSAIDLTSAATSDKEARQQGIWTAAVTFYYRHGCLRTASSAQEGHPASCSGAFRSNTPAPWPRRLPPPSPASSDWCSPWTPCSTRLAAWASPLSDHLKRRETVYQVIFIMSLCLLQIFTNSIDNALLWAVLAMLFLVNAGWWRFLDAARAA